MSFRNWILVGMIAVWLPSFAGAKSMREDLRFTRLSNLDGLPHMTIFSIVQDRRGLLWFGTQNGIARYDGYQFRIYRNDPLDPTSLSDNDAGGIVEGRQGLLWVRTWGGGLNRFDPDTGVFTRWRHDPQDPHSLPGDRIQTILEDSQGFLWVGTFADGLGRLDPKTGRFTTWRHNPNDPDSLSANRVWTILEDKDGQVWAGTDDGLNRFLPKKDGFEVFRHDPNNPRSLSHSQVRTLLQDSAGVLWVGTTSGLNAFDPYSGRAVRYEKSADAGEGPSNEVINAIYEDRRGRLWVGTIDGGLNRFDPRLQHFEAYRSDARDQTSLSSDDVRCILEDSSGSMWIGTRGGGVSKFDNNPRKFHLYQAEPENPDGLRRNRIFAVLEDREGTVWAGTWSGGLNRLDPQTGLWTQLIAQAGNPASLSGQDVNALLEDRQGQIWVGTWDAGLNLYDPQTGGFTHWRHSAEDPQSLSHDNILSLTESRDGRLWLGTREGGLNRFDPGTGHFEVWRASEDGLINDTVNAVLEDEKGRLWIGTDAGLNVRAPDSGAFQRFVHQPGDPESLAHNRVMSLHLDPTSGVLWVGTRGGGLSALDRETGRFRGYLEQDGLPSNTVYAILQDRSGNLWLSTDGGLSRFTPRTGLFRNYDVEDGLQANDFNPNSASLGSSGVMYFGGPNGINWFRPEDVKDNPHLPPVVLTAFKKLDRQIHFDRALYAVPLVTVNHGENVFSFEFAALDTVNPRKNQYAYKLEGFDPDWINAGNRRFASYTNLDGGEYTFRVKASNNDGVWNEEGASIRVHVVPPLWKTWWAYAAYVLVLIGSTTAYVGMRTRSHARALAIRTQELERQKVFVERLQKVDRLKDEFLANTSHELRTPLHGIIGLGESLLDGIAGPLPGAAQSNLSMIVDSGRRLFHLVNDILDLSRLKTRDLELRRKALALRPIADSVLRLCQPLLQGRPVQLKNEVALELPALDGDEDRLQQILHNLVGNAVKFTDSGSVTIRATSDEDWIEISVADTGIGIPEDRLEDIFRPFEQVDGSVARSHGGTGLGLSITRQLVELHGGRIGVESKLGVGSVFRFTMPRSKAGTVAVADAVPLDSQALPTEVAVAAPAPILVPENAPNLLVVDDDPVNLQVLINSLSLEGYRVRTAADGMEALTAVEQEPPHLVLLDVMMPGLSGYEVCRRLRHRWTAFDLPILMLTAKDRPGDIAAGLDSGANDYLSKPFSRTEMLARVRTLLDLRQAVGRALRSADQAAAERQRRMLAESFHDLSRALVSTLDLSEVFERLLESLERMVLHDSSAVSLQDDEGVRIVAVRGYGSSEQARRQHVGMHEDAVFSDALRSRQACAFVAGANQERPLAYRGLEQVEAGLALPLVCEGKFIGTVTLNRHRSESFTADETSVAFALCAEAGIAIQNARLYAEVRRMAITDGLTNLYNRQHFFALAERELQRARRYGHPLSLLMMDIDHFKKFNDAFGHVVGDKVLRQVADTCKRSLRTIDSIARYGGEEFAILLPETDSSLAEKLAERLRQTIADQPLQTEDYGSLSLTVSLGVSTLSSETPDITSLLQRADGALYQAKRDGRDRVVVR